MQYSQQLTLGNDQETTCSRSRALSNNLNALKERDENAGGGVKFLDYKKGKFLALLWSSMIWYS